MEKRLGGVLGVLTGQFFDLKRHHPAFAQASQSLHMSSSSKADASTLTNPSVPDDSLDPTLDPTSVQTRTSPRPARFVEEVPSPDTLLVVRNHYAPKTPDVKDVKTASIPQLDGSAHPKLRLEVLAFERVSLSVPVLSEAFDWTTIREITFLDCQFTASLWSAMRRKYTPSSRHERTRKPVHPTDYQLKIRKIHTNTITPVLLAFMRETLAPDSLEVLFLAQSQYHLATKVCGNDILKVIKRHRRSLRKILVDSSERDDTDNGSALAEGWDRWIFDRKMIYFVLSEKMPNLRELGMAISQKDWHFLLQHLPMARQIRALYLPYIAKSGNSYVPGEDARELSFQVLTLLTLAPEIELCYLAIANKCFEIIESRVKSSDYESAYGILHGDEAANGAAGHGQGEAEEEDEDEEDEEDEDSADGQGDGDEEDSDEVSDDNEDEMTSDEDGDDDSKDGRKSRVRMDIREILFYDDKVGIFKARHGRL